MVIYSLQDVSELLKISEPTARKYLKDGLLTGVKVGRQWRVTEEAIKKFMEHGTEKKKR